MERLQFQERLALKVNVFVNLRRGIEIENVDEFGGAADAVDAANSLHEARGVPRRIVNDDDMSAVKVHALGENFRGNENLKIVLAIGGVANRHVGVEIGADDGHRGAAV